MSSIAYWSQVRGRGGEGGGGGERRGMTGGKGLYRVTWGDHRLVVTTGEVRGVSRRGVRGSLRVHCGRISIITDYVFRVSHKAHHTYLTG